jgi:hypothetical protein
MASCALEDRHGHHDRRCSSIFATVIPASPSGASTSRETVWLEDPGGKLESLSCAPLAPLWRCHLMAVSYAVGANASHGLKRTNRCKRNAVMTLLKDPEWSG